MIIQKTKAQEKAKRSFSYQVKRASRCRHEKYHISCYACTELETCDIQKLLKEAQQKM